jgi:hypothetical protein
MLQVQRTEIAIPPTANCIYRRHPYLGTPILNKAIWEAHFSPRFNNNQEVIVGTGVVLVKLGTQYDVRLYTDDDWRPGNFIITLTTDYPAPNETDIVRNNLNTFFEELASQNICANGGKRSYKRKSRKTRKTHRKKRHTRRR